MADSPLKTAVCDASARQDVLAGVGRVYAGVSAEIQRRKPICSLSGRCCKFEEYGHRLYVSTLELAAFVAALPQTAGAGWGGTGCPFQQGKLCSVHTIRPFGCRMYFCDETATEWQQAMYEQFHTRIKALHEQFEIPYFYVEWRAGLRELGLARTVTEV